MEKVIWYLRKLDVLQGLYKDSNNEKSPVDPNEGTKHNPCGGSL